MKRHEGFRLGYRPALDGLRGVSVLAVMAHHAMLPYSDGGFIGVAVFFTLSGFLITMLLCDEFDRHGTIRLRGFYLRRILRLLPAFALLAIALGSYAALSLAADQRVRVFQQIVAAMLYVTNWMIAFEWWPKLGLLAHTWSLSLEEQFYSLWPALLLLGLRRFESPQTLLRLVVLGFVASTLWRSHLFSHSESYVRAYYGSFSNADMLLAGCGAALVLARRADGIPRGARRAVGFAGWIAAVGLVATAMFARVDAPILYHGGFALIAVASAFLVLSMLTIPKSALARLLAARPIVAIGKISYGLYLWHFPVYLIVRHELRELPGEAITATEITATFAAATLSYFLVERFFLALKSRTRTDPGESVGRNDPGQCSA